MEQKELQPIWTATYLQTSKAMYYLEPLKEFAQNRQRKQVALKVADLQEQGTKILLPYALCIDAQINERKAYLKEHYYENRYGKRNPQYEKAGIELEMLQNQKKLQQEQFASRMGDFRKRKELIDQKASLYGMKPIDIFNEGGKE